MPIFENLGRTDVCSLPWTSQSVQYTKMALDSEPPDQQSRLAHSRAGWLRGAFGRGPAPQFSVVKDGQ